VCELPRARVCRSLTRCGAFADVPLTVLASGLLSGALALVAHGDGESVRVASVCAHALPLVATTHLFRTLQRLFAGSLAEIQREKRATHRNYARLLGAHAVGAVASVAASAALPLRVEGARGALDALCSTALVSANVCALLYAAHRFQSCSLPAVSKLKDKLADFQRQARTLAVVCGAVYVPLVVYRLAVPDSPGWMAAMSMGSVAVQALTLLTIRRRAGDE
jgi:hypothetical protein